MTRILIPILLLGLVAGLSGCYVVSPYYPANAPPYPAPAPMPPPSAGSPPPRGAQVPPQGPARNCQTVTVEGHSETRVLPGGQREAVFVPTYTQRVCQ